MASFGQTARHRPQPTHLSWSIVAFRSLITGAPWAQIRPQAPQPTHRDWSTLGFPSQCCSILPALEPVSYTHLSQSADAVLSLAEHMEMDINRQPSDQVYEFENLEELRVFDESYQNHSNNQAMELISSVFQIPESEIHNIHCLKSGMTNKSFLFQVHGKSYICRVPGPGTCLLYTSRCV